MTRSMYRERLSVPGSSSPSESCERDSVGDLHGSSTMPWLSVNELARLVARAQYALRVEAPGGSQTNRHSNLYSFVLVGAAHVACAQ